MPLLRHTPHCYTRHAYFRAPYDILMRADYAEAPMPPYRYTPYISPRHNDIIAIIDMPLFCYTRRRRAIIVDSVFGERCRYDTLRFTADIIYRPPSFRRLMLRVAIIDAIAVDMPRERYAC